MASKKEKKEPEKAKKKKYDPKDDNREGRLHDVKTDRGTFRTKSNRKGED